jgi:hypothetical protein
MALVRFHGSTSLLLCLLGLPLALGCTITTGPAQPGAQAPSANQPPPPPPPPPAQPQGNNDDRWEGEAEATGNSGPSARDIERRRARPRAGAPNAPEQGPPTVSPRQGDPNAAGHKQVGMGPTANPTSEETRTNDAIARIIRENRQPFRECYERGAAKDPNLQGTLTLHFVLDPEGRVKLAELNDARSTIKDQAVVNCAIGVLKQLRFPPSSRGMESVANYPFDFKR